MSPTVAAYLESNQHFKDAASYLLRFQQCQNRAMTLVKLHVINTLKMATQNVRTQVQGGAGSSAEAGGSGVRYLLSLLHLSPR